MVSWTVYVTEVSSVTAESIYVNADVCMVELTAHLTPRVMKSFAVCHVPQDQKRFLEKR